MSDAPKKLHRLTLDVPPSFREGLAELQADLEAASLTEAVRRSAALARRLLRHVRAGGKVIFRDAGGTDREIVLL